MRLGLFLSKTRPMPVYSRHNNWKHATAISWFAVAQRFSFVIFLALSLGLLIVGRTNPLALQSTRVQVVDGVAPILSLATRPLELAEQFSNRLSTYASLQEENEKLRRQNAQIAQWQNTAIALGYENKELRSLLRFTPEPNLAYISARVIADTGGPFVRSLVVTAGLMDGVREGMAAMTGEGLVGRVVEVSDHSSRILMLTDLNSRLPVTIAGSGDHAILAGDNSSQMKLLYLSQDSVLQNGARVLTSGHGGIFPPNLPVGTVVSKERGIYTVAPLAALGHISYVRLVDFDLAGGPANDIANKLHADTKSR